jgi:hypothetical protein
LKITSIISAARAETSGMPTPELAPGQEWSIKSATPTTAQVIIDRLEPWHGQTIVHISVVNVPVPQGMPGTGNTMTTITHMPFEQAALSASLDQLLATGTAPPPGFEDGYKHWQDANGGIFTISVEEAVAFTLQVIGQG